MFLTDLWKAYYMLIAQVLENLGKKQSWKLRHSCLQNSEITLVNILVSVPVFCWLHAHIHVFSGIILCAQSFPGVSDGKKSPCGAADAGSIPGSGRSLGGGNGYPLHYSCLENPMDRGPWCVEVHEVAKSWTGLSNEHNTLLCALFVICSLAVSNTPWASLG